MMRVLVFGDSFAADWSQKYYDHYRGWSNMLRKDVTVTNLAQAGVSEYKIYKQLESVKWLDSYDAFIVSHTSPYRVPTRKHPVHSEDLLHYGADLIMSDIDYHASKFKNLFNFSLRSASNFFKYHYDQEYFETTYRLYRKAINDRLSGKKVITLNFFKDMDDYLETSVVDLSSMLPEHSGLINHMSYEGNRLVYEKVMGILESQ